MGLGWAWFYHFVGLASLCWDCLHFRLLIQYWWASLRQRLDAVSELL